MAANGDGEQDETPKKKKKQNRDAAEPVEPKTARKKEEVQNRGR